MASVDKVKIGSTTYDVSPSSAGTLKNFSSGDAASPSAWSAVDTITTSDTNATIFSKVTTMVKNVRYLYNKLGTTDFSAAGSTVSGALANLQANKASTSHSHTTAQLPISSSQINSDAYIPTSSLVYSMNQQISSLNDAKMNVSFTTNAECGAMLSGIYIDKDDTIASIVKRMLYSEFDYITFSSDSVFTVKFCNPDTGATQNIWNGTLSYSTNQTDWYIWDGSIVTSELNHSTGKHCVYITGKDNTHVSYTSSSVYSSFNIVGNNISVSGNIESLLDGVKVHNGMHTSMDKYCYAYIFGKCNSLVNASQLILPTASASYCCYNMFYNCSSLTTPPQLPATTLGNYCYYGIFRNCTSLATAPELPATTLADYCYDDMFYNCSSLTTPPALPATKIGTNSYERMFGYCASLTAVPELPLTETPVYYSSMFINCSSLKVSATKTGEYQYAWRIPKSGTGIGYGGWSSKMLENTGGTFTSDPAINTTYYVTRPPVG